MIFSEVYDTATQTCLVLTATSTSLRRYSTIDAERASLNTYRLRLYATQLIAGHDALACARQLNSYVN